jgi:hypothetical protein
MAVQVGAERLVADEVADPRQGLDAKAAGRAGGGDGEAPGVSLTTPGPSTR